MWHRTIERLSGAKRTVAIIVPMRNSAELTADEQISLRHLLYYLGKYDKYLVMPESLNFNHPAFQIRRFADMFFGSGRAHSRMMLSRSFYASFRKYRYILIYHLDALVFSDQLLDWCALDYDYIGAPWLKSPETPHFGFSHVGNGGFSLRKVESFLKVFDSPRYVIDPKIYQKRWDEHFSSVSPLKRWVNMPRKYLKHLQQFNNVSYEMKRYTCNEDHFWADEAIKYYPELKIAPVDIALRFAFELAPRYCFEQNNHQLPFGCHGWDRHDREFWQPYLLC